MVSEVDYHRFLPSSVVFHTARLRQTDDSGIGTDDNLRGLVETAPEAARSVGLANPDLLVYSCTAGSFFKGPTWHAELSSWIEQESGIPTITTSTALVTALATLGARSVFMASPYPEFVNEAERSFLGAHGFDITAVLSFGCTLSQEIYSVTPETIVEQVLARADEVRRNDVLFLTCTGLRSMEVVDELERALDVPVMTSNSSSMWLALSRLGVDTSALPLGRLYASSPVPVPEPAA
jgi:maleate isomerase